MELRQLFEIMWRRKWIGMTVFATIFLSIVGTSLLITNWYDSTARVLLRHSLSTSSLLDTLDLRSGTIGQVSVSDTERYTYIAMATLKPIANRVAKELDLKRERVRAKLMKAFPILKPMLRLIGVDVDSTEKAVTGEDLIKSSLTANIFPRPYVEVSQYEETDMLEIEAISPDPKQARDIAQKMAEGFIEMERRMVADDYAAAKSFIAAKIEKTRTDYIKAQVDIETFKKQQKIAVLDTEISNTVDRLTDLKVSIDGIDVSVKRSQTAVAILERKLTSMDKFQKSSEQLSRNDVITELKSDLFGLYMDLSDTRTKYTSDHPNVIDIKNKIDLVKDLMKKEVLKVYGGETLTVDPVFEDFTQQLASYYIEIESSRAQKKALLALVERYEAKLMSYPEKVSANAHLQLAFNLSQSMYQSMLTMQRRIEIAESIDMSNIVVVEQPVIANPKESKHKHPNMMMNTLVAILLGTFFGLGGIFLTEYVDDSVLNVRGLKEVGEIPCIGSVGKIRKKRKQPIDTVLTNARLREYFKRIRLEMQFLLGNDVLSKLFITSLYKNEGKSFVGANLGILEAVSGKKVLIIDGNYENPGAHEYFNLQTFPGLGEFLSKGGDGEKLVQQTQVDGLSIIPTGSFTPGDKLGIASDRVFDLIKKMEAIYDKVIFITPPAHLVSDAFILMSRGGGKALAVVESGRTQKQHLAEFLDTVKKAHISFLGAVMNKQPGMRYFDLDIDLKPRDVYDRFTKITGAWYRRGLGLYKSYRSRSAK